MADTTYFRQLLKLTVNSNGTITRQTPVPDSPPNPIPNPNSITLSKDIPLNPNNKTYIRLYKPNTTVTAAKLPIIIYFHGGGFVFFSPASTPIHESCCYMSAQFNAVILSVEYRLAPENRLPAAYDDAVEAIYWLRDVAKSDKSDSWLSDCHVDFSKTFVMGSSAGGNIGYHAVLRSLDFNPVKIVGLILNQAYFGGVQRSKSELDRVEDMILPLDINESMWDLALPLGADRDHEFCNVAKSGVHVNGIERLPRCLVTELGEDPLLDRQKEFVKMLKSRGVHVQEWYKDSGYHAIELFEPNKAQDLFQAFKEFMDATISDVEN